MNNCRLKLTAAMLAGALLSPLIQAAEEERIIVTATRTAQIADQTLASVIVITREDIERSQAIDIADLLRMHAGLDIGRNGGPGQATSLFLRGSDSNHVLVMIDGVKINPGTIGGAALQNINPQIIERIEIVKGPRSALYGSEAIGGVINIITRHAGSSTTIEAIAGSNNYHQLSADLHHTNNKLRSGLSISSLKTDGFAPLTSSPQKSGHTNTSINAYAGTKLANSDIELSHWQASGNTEYVDFFLSPADQDFINSSTALTIKLNPKDNWATTIKLARISDEIDQNQSIDYAHTNRNVLDWQNDLQLGQQLLTAGIMLTRENTAAESFGTTFDQDTAVNAVFLQSDNHAGKHHTILSARFTDHETFGNHTTWSAEYGFKLNENTRLSAASSTGFRAPDSSDRFGYGGNINLAPEISHNYELGIEHHLDEEQTISAHAFDNQIEDLINCVGSYPCTNVNVNQARINGLEISYRLSKDIWGMQLEAIRQNPKNRDTGEPLARRAKNSLSGSVYYEKGHYLLSTSLTASSKRKDSDFSSIYNPGYSLTSISLAYALTDKVKLTGKVENLFDKDYTLADGYNTADRSFFIELRYTPYR
jgi:vitamin B12 transporter